VDVDNGTTGYIDLLFEVPPLQEDDPCNEVFVNLYYRNLMILCADHHASG
jgi:hypothetical protein